MTNFRPIHPFFCLSTFNCVRSATNHFRTLNCSKLFTFLETCEPGNQQQQNCCLALLIKNQCCDCEICEGNKISWFIIQQHSKHTHTHQNLYFYLNWFGCFTNFHQIFHTIFPYFLNFFLSWCASDSICKSYQFAVDYSTILASIINIVKEITAQKNRQLIIDYAILIPSPKYSHFKCIRSVHVHHPCPSLHLLPFSFQCFPRLHLQLHTYYCCNNMY